MRVPDAGEATLKRALDRGARSVMVPMVNTAEAAALVAANCLYPPRGRRGYAAPIVRASHYGARPDYAAHAHEELLLMVQIEHADALPHVAAIAGVPGVDMVFIGPNDLVASMGHLEQLRHPDLARAVGEVEAEVRRQGVMLGTVEGGGRNYAALRDAGYGLIVGPDDITLLATAARAAHARSRKELLEVIPAGV